MTFPAMSTPLASPTYLLDGLLFNGRDEFGVDWVVTQEEGWSSGAPVRITASEREGADGAYSSSPLRGARIITLTGTTIAPSQHAMVSAKDRFNAVASGEGRYTLVVAEKHLTRQALVTHGGDPKVEDTGPIGFRWQLVLRSDDPLKYSAELITPPAISLPPMEVGGLTFPLVFPITFGGGSSSGGSTSWANLGNAATWPVFTINGPVVNPAIQNVTTGEVLEFQISLSAEEFLVVDSRRRTVLLNGTASRRNTLRPGGAFFRIRPGSNDIRFRAASYDAAVRLAVAYRHAWK